jgi:hypothetical protein
MSNFADGLFPGHLASFLMLLPFVMLGFGLWFICRALTDKVDARPGGRIAVLPDRKNLPLYHVHLQIRASARPRPSPPSEKPERGSSGLPRGHRHHGTRLVVRQ